MNEFVLCSQNVLTPTGQQPAFIHISNGTITSVGPLEPTGHLPVVDVGRHVIMPGVIDPHVHINEPGRTEWEGFHTITRAAIAGGVTTLVDMPLNASPVTTSAAAFEKKLAATEGQLHTHCGFWGGLVPGNVKEIEPLIEKGVLGFKAFLTHSGIDDFPNVTADDLHKAMPILAKHGLPLLVHCELSEENLPTGSNPRSYAAYLASRPRSWEDRAIALMIRLCEEHNCPVHIVHLSSATSIETLQRARERGLPLTVETAQHYLFFCAEEIRDGDTAFKCAPPIREKENNEQLWQALNDGIIDFVATDHSPVTPDLKELATGDFTRAWGGIASLQLAFPVLWTAAAKRGLPLEKVVNWLSGNPAKLVGHSQKKGRIAPGFDADLIIVDPEEKFRVTADMLYHKHKITPYLGSELAGVVKQTFLKGIHVYDDGHMQANCGELLFST